MNSWDTRLAERKSVFVRRCRWRLDEVEGLLHRIMNGDSNKDDFGAVVKHFHQIAGSGGLFALTRVCELAIAAEEVSKELFDRCDKQAIEQLRELVEQLRICLEGGSTAEEETKSSK